MKLSFAFLIAATAGVLLCGTASAEYRIVLNKNEDADANASSKISPLHNMLLLSILTTRAEELADSQDDQDQQMTLDAWWHKKGSGSGGTTGNDETPSEENLIEDPITVMIRKGVNADDLGVEEKSYMSNALLFSFNQVHDANDKDYHGMSAQLLGTGKVEVSGDNDNNTPTPGGLRLGYTRYTLRDYFIFSMNYTCRFCGRDRRRKLLTSSREDSENTAIVLNAQAKANLHKEWEKKYCEHLVNSGLPAFENAEHCLIQTVDNYMMMQAMSTTV